MNTPLKRSIIVLLKAVIILIGIGTLAGMLWEPHLEGRNSHATLFEIYFNDPFLAYVYIGSIPFFVALYQVLKLVGYIGQHQTFSVHSVRALRTIKYCGITLVAFIAGAEAWILITQSGKDDIAGGVAMGLFATLVSIVIAAAAAVFERLIQKGYLICSATSTMIPSGPCK